MRAAGGRGARAGAGRRAVQAVGAGQLARARAEGGRLPRPRLVTQTRRGLGGRGEVLGDLDVAVGGHLVLEQQRLPPLLGQGSLPRRAAACNRGHLIARTWPLLPLTSGQFSLVPLK